MEPLNEETDARDDPVYPHDDANQDPVEDPDEQLDPACVVFIDKELLWCGCSFWYNNHQSSGSTDAVIKSTPARSVYYLQDREKERGNECTNF